ncbi:MAG: formyl transferase [Acetobacter sp.]|nr:formyl transferase [Acetobacter sp.]MBQ5478912.1 formyl transferase [Acetobacter sp.]MBQ5497482.1 formyl transferase [Acetobacter sp.]
MKLKLERDIWNLFCIDQPLLDILASPILMAERNEKEKTQAHTRTHTSSFLQAISSTRTITNITPKLSFYTFMADPFCFQKEEKIYLFTEFFDYRTRHGIIECLTFNKQMTLLERRPVLSEPWHLSYPYVIEDNEAIYMLPESSKTGNLFLYRATSFPNRWERVTQLNLGHDIPIDATPVRYKNMWWLFYLQASPRQNALHAAYSHTLYGPWTCYHQNPILVGTSSARPGGTPITLPDGRLVLPVQDCSQTYGGTIHPLVFETLTPEYIHCHAYTKSHLGEYTPQGLPPFTRGTHTLCALGEKTIFDAKAIDLSPRGIFIQCVREIPFIGENLAQQL